MSNKRKAIEYKDQVTPGYHAGSSMPLCPIHQVHMIRKLVYDGRAADFGPMSDVPCYVEVPGSRRCPVCSGEAEIIPQRELDAWKSLSAYSCSPSVPLTPDPPPQYDLRCRGGYAVVKSDGEYAKFVNKDEAVKAMERLLTGIASEKDYDWTAT